MFKIYIPFLEFLKKAASVKILLEGIKDHPLTQLGSCEKKSDFIFLDFRHAGICGCPNYSCPYPDKTVMIDYYDGAGAFPALAPKVLAYFKRSVVEKPILAFRNYLKFQQLDREIIPISYCVKEGATAWDITPLRDRPIDISVFFNPDSAGSRGKMASFIKATFLNKYKISIGYCGASGQVGRNTIQKKYYDKILDSKIVINCNPDLYEGDWRLFEALSGAPLVMVDKMITPVVNPFVDKKHLIYYDVNNFGGLASCVDYYLNNLEEAQAIASQGYTNALTNHQAKNRIDEILSVITKKK
jgi:hypothetical protein